jgi:hypothetical protein
MFKIDIDPTKLIERCSDLEKKQLPFATMLAINDAMFDVREGWKKEITTVFDRPTPLTINAVLYKKATLQNLTAEVFLRDEATKGTPPSRYLIEQVEGDDRAEKPFEFLLRNAGIIGGNEFVVPARNFPLDAFGNVPGGVLTAILSDLQGSRDAKANSTAESRRRRSRRKNVEKAHVYFYDRGDRGKLPRGIYQRQGTRAGSGIRMVLAIVEGAPRYSKRFDAYAIASRIFNASFPIRFDERLAFAVRTAKIK